MIDDEIGPYRILQPLGAGGMAQVFLAERIGEAGFRKRVAIKRILPQYRKSNSLLERFASEARTNARLDHPNLVQVIDFGIDPEPFLALEYVEGAALSGLLDRVATRRERLLPNAVIYLMIEAAQGLGYAHRKRDDAGRPLGIVHRDVSPQNILLSKEGAVKVSDFGLVKVADSVLKTNSGMPLGKISYMAPEQSRGEEVDARADIFSLGVVMWECLALRPLLPREPAEAAVALSIGKFPAPSQFQSGIPLELDQLVMGCLGPEPGDRIPSMEYLVDSLRTLGAQYEPFGAPELKKTLLFYFPERGWSNAETTRPASQPTEQERLSIHTATPAAVAVEIAKQQRELSDAIPWKWVMIGALSGAGGLLLLALIAVVLYLSLR